MKKALSVLLILTVAIGAFALSLNFHLGLVSGFGVSEEFGHWHLGADLESTFPVYGIANGIASKYNGNTDFSQYVKIGNRTFFGADVYGYRHLYKGTRSDILAGCDFLFGMVTASKTFEAGLRPSIKYAYNFNDKISAYAVVGLPVVSIVYGKGFKAPFVQIPKQNYATILTGTKLGLTYSF